ncbi:hypothetical protein P4220_00015 [Pseudomonas aeruginosa]|nr:hypothetical protein [Pseudomonas aeruginosa]
MAYWTGLLGGDSGDRVLSIRRGSRCAAIVERELDLGRGLHLALP